MHERRCTLIAIQDYVLSPPSSYYMPRRLAGLQHPNKPLNLPDSLT